MFNTYLQLPSSINLLIVPGDLVSQMMTLSSVATKISQAELGNQTREFTLSVTSLNSYLGSSIDSGPVVTAILPIVLSVLVELLI